MRLFPPVVILPAGRMIAARCPGNSTVDENGL